MKWEEALLSLANVEPTVERIITASGYVWRVCGLGYCTEHQQRWQAEVMYECLLVAKGLHQKAIHKPDHQP